MNARVIFPARAMEMMDVSLMERFYSKLFSTPKGFVSAGIIVISIVLASILNGSGSFFGLRYLSLSLITFVALLIYQKFLKLAVNKRRLLFFVMTVLIFIELFDILSVHVFGRDLIVLAPASITALLTVSFYFISESSEVRCAVASLILSILLYPASYYFSFQAPHRTLGYIATALIGSVLGYLFIKYLDRDFEFFNVKRFLKAFLLFWLTCDAEYFEKELRRVGVRFRGWVKCLRIGKVKLISTSFHPGPMRNIGGAKLVHRILSSIENSIFLHTAVGHELNPVDGENVERIVSAVKCDCAELKAEKPFEIEGNLYILRVFPFGKVRLVILIGKNETDDLPFELNEIAGRYVMLVEAHSAHRSNFEVTEDHIREVKDLIERSKNVKTDKTDLKYFFKRIRAETKNICGYVAILILDYGDEKHAILMLDGNNVDLSFRNEIEKFCEGFDVRVTVISTDNHSKTGISPKIGYKPVGADEEDRKIVFEFLKDVFENVELESCDVISYGFNEVEVKVMGRRFFELVELAFRSIGEKAIYLFFSMIAFQFVLASILGRFIM